MNLEQVQQYIADRIIEEIEKNGDDSELKKIVYQQLILLRHEARIWFDHMRLFTSAIVEDEYDTFKELTKIFYHYTEDEQMKMFLMAKEQSDLRKEFGKKYYDAVRIIVEVDKEARTLYDEETTNANVN